MSDETNVDKLTTYRIVDLSFLKDMGDVVRSRNLFFVPFFGAFIAFLVTQSNYIKQAGSIIQIELFGMFILGVFYSYQLATFMHGLETLRFMSTMKSHPDLGKFFLTSDKEVAEFHRALITVQPAFKHEARLFKWTMRALWIVTSSVLMDVFLKDFETRQIESLLGFFAHGLGVNVITHHHPGCSPYCL